MRFWRSLGMFNWKSCPYPYSKPICLSFQKLRVTPIDHNIDVQYVYQFSCFPKTSCFPKLARNYEIEHWSRCSKTINWSADSFQINHVTSMSWHMSRLYGQSWDTGQWLSCFDSGQLTILWMSNVKDVDLPRHAWDTPPFLLMVSSTPPVQSLDAYLRSVNHVTTKRKEVDHIRWIWG